MRTPRVVVLVKVVVTFRVRTRARVSRNCELVAALSLPLPMNRTPTHRT